MKKFKLLVLLSSMISAGVFGGGYQVGLHGHKQIGMGLVGTSLTDDASSLFYNPGSISFIKPDYSFAFGVSGINSYTAFHKSGPSTNEAMTDNPIGTPFYFYGSVRISDRFTAGLAINTPYGNSLSWGKDWVGRYLVQDLALKAIFYQPTITYKINESLGVGVGLVYVSGDFEFNKALPVSDANGEGSINISGSTSKIGFNAGVLVKPTDGLNIGVDYRSAVDMEVDGADAQFDVPVSLKTSFPNTTVKTKLPLPANLDIGVSYNITEKLMVAMSLNYVYWSAYDSLIFDFTNNTTSLTDSRNPRLYSNKMIYRIGGECKVNESFYLRAGGYYDPSPVNNDYFSPETPNLNCLGISTGFSYYPIKKLAIDVSFLYISGKEADRTYKPDNFGGTYKAHTYISGLGLTFNF